MKTSKLFYLPILLLSAFLIFSCDSPSNSNDDLTNNGNVQTPTESNPQKPNNPKPTPSTSNASTEELAVLTEMNYARTNPKGYVTERLQPLVSTYTGSKLSSLNELISEMNSMSALTAYEWGNSLARMASDWVTEQGPTGTIGHGEGSNSFSNRIKNYCSYSSCAENISYGYNQAVDIVIQLLVDDGVSTRGHRKNILSPSYTHAGAAIGTHKVYRYMCCIDFAGGYSEK